MTRENLAEVLDEIALLLELKDENPFKIRAYRNGAETVRNFDGDIVQLAIDNELKGIKGIGDALQDKLHELASTGSLEFHRKLRAEFPEGLTELFDLQGLGPKKVKVLHQSLGIGSLADLKTACAEGKVAGLPDPVGEAPGRGAHVVRVLRVVVRVRQPEDERVRHAVEAQVAQDGAHREEACREAVARDGVGRPHGGGA